MSTFGSRARAGSLRLLVAGALPTGLAACEQTAGAPPRREWARPRGARPAPASVG